MGDVVIISFSPGDPILSSQVNANFNSIKNQVNGNLENSNISGTAAIEDTKLDQIVSSGKVDGTTAITGLIPSANQDTIGTLVDASPIATDASAATIFTVTLADNRTLENPTNAVAGMKRIWRFTQDGAGNRVLTLDTDFRVSKSIGGGTVVLSTGAGEIDYMGAIYDGTNWDVIALSKDVS